MDSAHDSPDSNTGSEQMHKSNKIIHNDDNEKERRQNRDQVLQSWVAVGQEPEDKGEGI